MAITKKDIECCGGKYHILVDGKYYCMAPPNVKCAQHLKDVGKFTRGEKKILYCVHNQQPCSKCSAGKDKKKGIEDVKED